MPIDLRSASSALPTGPGAGEDLRYAGLYDQIREARTEEDASLSLGIWEHELKRADWSTVESLCSQALGEQTKDLQVAVWLCEAWCHQYEWEGLSASFAYLQDFCINFWDPCYPVLDSSEASDIGLEHRLRILEWFLNMTADTVVFLPIVRPTSIISQKLDYATWLTALNLDLVQRRVGGSDHTDANGETITLARYRTILQQAPADQLTAVAHYAQKTAQQTLDLEAALRPLCYDQEPIFKSLRDTLADVERLCAFGLDRPSAAPRTQESPASVATAEALEEPTPAQQIDQEPTPLEDSNAGARTISSSQEAYQALSELADYLIEIDSHSPAPYLAKLASSWGEKPLPAILEDAASGSSQGHHILKMLANIVKVQ